MRDEKNSLGNIEKKIQVFFRKAADSLKAPADLWSKLEPQLNEEGQEKTEAKKDRGIGRWLRGSRLIGVSISTAVVLVLIVLGATWLANLGTGNGNSRHASISPGFTVTTIATTTSVMQSGGAAVPPPKITLTIPATTSVPSPKETFGSATPSNGTVSGSGAAGTSKSSDVLDTTQRQVLYQASVLIEVQTVSTALTQVQTLAQSLGGTVDNMSSNGGPDEEQATITIRVPEDQFFNALSKLQSFGTVQSQSMSSQDVTEQFIDLQARLTSAQAEEQSLLTLLSKAQAIGDIISIQQQLTDVRSQIETLQGQINYIQNRVDMSSITVTLSTPAKNAGQPPSGSVTVGVSNVDDSLATVKNLVQNVNGVIDKDYISINNGKESAALSVLVFRADFDRVMTTIQKQGKVQQQTIQEATGTQTQTPSGGAPDARIDVNLNQSSGFWTTANIVVVTVAACIVVIALVVFLAFAWRAGLLKKRT